VVVLLALVALLTACSNPSNNPDTYDAQTEANYLNGCLAVADIDLERAVTVDDNDTSDEADDSVVIPDDVPEDALAVCQCQYGAMTEVVGETQDGDPEYALPFDQFERLNDDLENNLPESPDDSAADEGEDTTTTILSETATDLIASCNQPS
jgi:hypothetical protein